MATRTWPSPSEGLKTGPPRTADRWRPAGEHRTCPAPSQRCPPVSSAARALQPASQAAATPTVRLGLRANWPQFTLLMVVNAFVGGMVGLALGLNEAAGYMAVGATALATGYLAAAYGLRPVPELLGVIYAGAGLALSVLVVRDTAAHVAAEAATHPGGDAGTTRQSFST